MGSRLLAAAEQEACRRGCRQMVLMTFSFQAPAFYLKHGFEVIAVVDHHPRGHTNLLLRKRLGGPSRAEPNAKPGTASRTTGATCHSR